MLEQVGPRPTSPTHPSLMARSGDRIATPPPGGGGGGESEQQQQQAISPCIFAKIGFIIIKLKI